MCGGLRNLEIGFAVSLRGEDIAALHAQRFAGKPDQPLDVIHLGVARKLEDHHVPSLGVAQRVGKLVDDDPVAAEGGLIFDRFVGPRDGGIEIGAIGHHVPAIRAHPRHGLRTRAKLRCDRLPAALPRVELPHDLVVRLLARAHLIPLATLRALDIFVHPHQRRRHRTGGDDERLGRKGAEEKREDERDDNRLD